MPERLRRSGVPIQSGRRSSFPRDRSGRPAGVIGRGTDSPAAGCGLKASSFWLLAGDGRVVVEDVDAFAHLSQDIGNTFLKVEQHLAGVVVGALAPAG